MPTNGPPPKHSGPRPVSPPPPDFLNGEHQRAVETLRRMCIAMSYTAPGFVMGWPGSTWPDGFEIVQSSCPPTTMISMRLDRFEEIVAALRSK